MASDVSAELLEAPAGVQVAEPAVEPAADEEPASEIDILDPPRSGAGWRGRRSRRPSDEHVRGDDLERAHGGGRHTLAWNTATGGMPGLKVTGALGNAVTA